MERKKICIYLLIILVVFSSTGVKKVDAHNHYDFRNLSTWQTVGYNYSTSGGFVGAVQSMLWASNLKDTVGSVDQSYGPKTNSAVKEFQRRNGLSVDGNVGPATWGKFEQRTYNVDSRTRRYRGGSAHYQVTFKFFATGGSTTQYNYYLEQYNGGTIYTSGVLWTDFGASSRSTLSPLKEDELDKKMELEEVKDDVNIPLNIDEDIDYILGNPLIDVEEREDGFAIVSWYDTKEGESIMVSQSINEYGKVSSLMDEIENVWYKNKKVKKLNIAGHEAIVEQTEHGNDTLHIVTNDNVYTVAGIKEAELIEISRYIELK
ncbi:peptidoglycan-binding protein [Sutcliffiella cohnii]